MVKTNEKSNSKKTCLTNEEKRTIITEITKRVPSLECPMCKHREFVLGEGYFANVLQFDLKITYISGKSLPSIPIVCKNCGFISQHALGVLQLLDVVDTNANDDTNSKK